MPLLPISAGTTEATPPTSVSSGPTDLISGQTCLWNKTKALAATLSDFTEGLLSSGSTQAGFEAVAWIRLPLPGQVPPLA